MRDKMWTVIVLVWIVAMFFLVGCAGIEMGQSSVCTDVTPEESLICQKIPNPEMVSTALLAANYAALRGDAYGKDAALNVISELEGIVQAGGITYMYIITKVAELLEQDEAAAVILILSPNINLLDSPLTITEFDQGLLLAHLEYQRQLMSVVQ